jgi:hypothetical protein
MQRGTTILTYHHGYHHRWTLFRHFSWWMRTSRHTKYFRLIKIYTRLFLGWHIYNKQWTTKSSLHVNVTIYINATVIILKTKPFSITLTMYYLLCIINLVLGIVLSKCVDSELPSVPCVCHLIPHNSCTHFCIIAYT